MNRPGITFVAGATGYTGREVVRAAVAAGSTTVAHVRPDSPRVEQWRRHFAELGANVDTTPWNPEAMTATLTALQPSVVFALLGTTRARGRQAGPNAQENYESVDFGLTMLLLDAARACAPPPRFVYLSVLGVGPKARGAYLSVRWRAEQAIAASGLGYAIARPSIISGTDRDEFRVGERVAARVLDGALRLAPKLRMRYGSTSNVELARGLVRVGFDAGLGDRVFGPDELR